MSLHVFVVRASNSMFGKNKRRGSSPPVDDVCWNSAKYCCSGWLVCHPLTKMKTQGKHFQQIPLKQWFPSSSYNFHLRSSSYLVRQRLLLLLWFFRGILQDYKNCFQETNNSQRASEGMCSKLVSLDGVFKAKLSWNFCWTFLARTKSNALATSSLPPIDLEYGLNFETRRRILSQRRQYSSCRRERCNYPRKKNTKLKRSKTRAMTSISSDDKSRTMIM